MFNKTLSDLITNVYAGIWRLPQTIDGPSNTAKDFGNVVAHLNEIVRQLEESQSKCKEQAKVIKELEDRLAPLRTCIDCKKECNKQDMVRVSEGWQCIDCANN